ncbi:MAG: tyrosine phosphatase family protein [Pseudomonadota bacterium]
MLYVCSLSQLSETAVRTRAETLITLINAGTPVHRPASIDPENHLFLGFNDIVEPMEGFTPPGMEHVRELIEFARKWDRQAPMIVHCWAGISRSTAGAYIISCARNPDADEAAVAASLRAASPSATPNARLVALADELLEREGRMIRAIEAIGRGANAYEGAPFMLDVEQ